MNHTREQVLARFKCQQSGNCCKCPGVVYVSQSDIDNMSKLLDMTVLVFRQEYVQKKNGWDVISTTEFRPNCFLNDRNECSVYSARPKSCRTYPDWDLIWESESSLMREAELCPGLKKALKV